MRLPELSNYGCLPSKAGGLLFVLSWIFAQSLPRHAARKARRRLALQYLHEALPYGFYHCAQSDGGRGVWLLFNLCRKI